MASYLGPNIVTSGLVLCLDAGNTKSYPGSGTLWTDLSGNGSTGTLTGGPTFNSSLGGSISFDGVDDYIAVPSLGTLSAYTISYWARRDSENRMLVSSGTGASFYWYGDSSWRYTHGGVGGEYYYPKPTSIPVSTWGNYVVTYNGSAVRIYRQGVFQGQQSTTGTANFSMGLRFGWFEGGNSYSFLGLASNFQVYSRALSDTEVQQNFIALRGRFGI